MFFFSEQRDVFCEEREILFRVKPAFGGELFSFFRHNSHFVGPYFERNAYHAFIERHLQIKMFDAAAQHKDVAVLDVPAVFAQMSYDRTGAGLYA